jgi:hypothetical protein
MQPRVAGSPRFEKARFRIKQDRPGGGRPHKPRSTRQGYRPGDVITESGIYEVIHYRGHRETHDAVMVRGNQFPACEQCGASVRFKMKRTAPYIFHDEDFAS